MHVESWIEEEEEDKNLCLKVYDFLNSEILRSYLFYLKILDQSHRLTIIIELYIYIIKLHKILR